MSVGLLPLAALWVALCAPAQAAFEVAVTPSRFELEGRSAQRMGQVLEIQNLGGAATQLSVRTLDWRYSAAGELSLHDELLDGSCRPWVTIERKLVQVPARGTVRFRFQIDIPAEAPRSECRFILAIEGVEPAQQAVIDRGGASLSLPVNGRIAVTVYVGVNGAQPQLELLELGQQAVNGTRQATVTVRNSGDAHGRLDGSLDAKDADGMGFELVPEGTPVLPGQTRVLPLHPRRTDAKSPPVPRWPIRASGALDWDRGAFKINAELP
ncbi:hypothetical protein CCO03_11790 [Comamonas serinivorans]|uniref:Pili assembly chaperone N-terminal domain-containing protein n=1 Tax=Comamonas serinivorans TaxID=1082851 RepID=A0A1Y0ET23_9BURK|nr:hypothetical protein CCO03_11790 [Comamonas serinivorans]